MENQKSKKIGLATQELWALSALSASEEKIQACLANGADARAADEDGETALMMAARRARPNLVKALIPVSDLAAVSADGHERTLLMLAAMADFSDRTRECLEALIPVSDPGARDSNGLSALGLALRNVSAQEDWIESIDLLARHNKPTAEEWKSLARHAVKRNHMALFNAAAANCDLSDLQVNLANDKADPSQNSFSEPILAQAARVGNPSVIRALLAAGCDAKATTKHEGPPLVILAQSKKTAGFPGRFVCEGLEMLAAVSDPDAVDEDGNTALMHAAASGSVDRVRVLLKRGNPNAQNHRGATALHLAVEHSGNEAVIDALTPLTDLGLCDKEGKTALDIAVEGDEWGALDAIIAGMPPKQALAALLDNVGVLFPRSARVAQAQLLETEAEIGRAVGEANYLRALASGLESEAGRGEGERRASEANGKETEKSEPDSARKKKKQPRRM